MNENASEVRWPRYFRMRRSASRWRQADPSSPLMCMVWADNAWETSANTIETLLSHRDVYETFDHHPAPVSDGPKCEAYTPTKPGELDRLLQDAHAASLAATDWQPFDGEFKAGVFRIRKKPVEVEAVHYNGTLDSFMAIHDWMGSDDDPNHPNCGYQGTDEEPGKFGIKTLEGKITASPGDWIIKGVKGEFYPCKPDVFEATYDPET